MINLFEISYVNWIDYLNEEMNLDFPISQDLLYVFCNYFYFG